MQFIHIILFNLINRSPFMSRKSRKNTRRIDKFTDSFDCEIIYVIQIMNARLTCINANTSSYTPVNG